MSDDIASRYSHLIGQTYGDGSHGDVVSIDVYGPKLVMAVLTDGAEVNVTALGKDQ